MFYIENKKKGEKWSSRTMLRPIFLFFSTIFQTFARR
jgi:hypothetical protein